MLKGKQITIEPSKINDKRKYMNGCAYQKQQRATWDHLISKILQYLVGKNIVRILKIIILMDQNQSMVNYGL